ncbi:Sensor histidine kinase RcsC [Pseudoalteromonas holothuriae]|uniref:Sensor histidine kinase RcsC n=1 Tax=Pseudoalteromonas holothuriae TaxID=2963714 RepID=A0A9W4QUR7_9GAMM|nr:MULTISPECIES: response regulator [unclassified Pseudoalteromonas]CAH9053870.1 Sensor histidine kinase RcsC [Pseudoalteromonas sp. CIP111854]CAH9060970.1 Sensor histidine kinase RcsC [Pseudoalteromonas sp. CIP111951]
MNILSVDDNPQNRMVLEKALSKQYDITSSNGSDPILELMETHQPQVVLMDIMLGTNYTGYDLVKEIKAHGAYNECEIIFISALTSSEDKLTAYGSGGDDYIAKPVDFKELREKLKRVELRISERNDLKEMFEMASSTAFTSMQQASELGELVTFFTDNLEVSDLNILFENIKHYYANAGVTCCIEFRVAGQHEQFPKQTITDLEKEILELGRNAKRIVPFGSNLLFNSPNCSMLVKGIHANDEDVIGRLRDNFAILLTIIDSRVDFIEEQVEKSNIRQKALNNLKSQLTDDFGTIKTLCFNQDAQIKQLVNDLSQAVQLKIITLGLDEEQESELMCLVDETKEVVEETLGLSFVLEDKLRNITDRLKAVE